jgi:hypothetical protein
MKKIIQFIKGTFKDKLQNPSGREVTVFILVIIVITSWIAEQFFGKHIPQFMFFGFISLIAAGLGLYTFESPISPNENNMNTNTESDVKQN